MTVIPVGSMQFGFVQITHALLLGPGAARLSDPAFRLACIALARAGELGGNAELSYSFLRQCTGASDDRIGRMKRDLCAALPHVFSIIPGDRQKGTGDAIRIDLEALTTEHVAHLNWREEQKAKRRHEAVRRRFAVAGKGGTPEFQVPRKSGKEYPEIRGGGTPEVGDNKKIPKDVEDNYTYRFTPLSDEAVTAEHQASMPETQNVQHAQKAEKPAKDKGSAACRALSTTDLQRFVDAWNAGKHERFAGKRVASPAERRALDALVAAHDGDTEAALETWMLAVQEVTRLGADRNALFWGDATRKPAPTMANLLPHWGKHSDAARNRTEQPAVREFPHDLATLQPWM